VLGASAAHRMKSLPHPEPASNSAHSDLAHGAIPWDDRREERHRAGAEAAPEPHTGLAHAEQVTGDSACDQEDG
jgi:hypothetical protein